MPFTTNTNITGIVQGSEITGQGGIGGFNGIPSAASSAISQMTSTVARLGGRLYWSPSAAIGPSAFVNSDGSGGATPISGLVGLALDQSGGWGRGPNVVVNGAPTSGVFAPWESFSTRVTMSAVNGWIRGTFNNTSIYFGQNGSFNFPSGSAVLVSFRIRANRAGNVTFSFSTGAFGFSDAGTRGGFSVGTAEQTYTFVLPSTAAVNSIQFSSLDLTSGGDFLEVTDVVVSRQGAMSDAITQPTTGNKPLLVPGATAWANALLFDGTNDTLISSPLPAASTETVISAQRFTNFASARDIFNRGDVSATGAFTGRASATGALSIFMHDGVSFTSATSSAGVLSAVDMQVVSMVKGASRYYGRVNGVEVVTNAVAGVAQLAPATLRVAGTAFTLPMAATQAGLIWVPVEPSAADFAVMERGLGFIAGTVTI